MSTPMSGDSGDSFVLALLGVVSLVKTIRQGVPWILPVISYIVGVCGPQWVWLVLKMGPSI